MDFLLTYGLARMKHFSFVYFSMLLHDSEEGCSHFVLEASLMGDQFEWFHSVILISKMYLFSFTFFFTSQLAVVKTWSCDEIVT